MGRQENLAFLPAMFAACMLFQTLYVLCVLLWFVAPDLGGHAILAAIFPGFGMLNLGTFIYGFMMSMVYGWVVAATFVFFYNLWPTVASLVFGARS